MAVVLTLPDTEPRRRDLGDASARRALSGAAVPAVLRLLAAWAASDQQSADLLGGVSLSTLRRWRRRPPVDLGVDGLTRASLLLGIYRALHVMLDPANADTWMTRPNSGPMFGGRTPLQLAVSEGIPGLGRIRDHLDAIRGGR